MDGSCGVGGDAYDLIDGMRFRVSLGNSSGGAFGGYLEISSRTAPDTTLTTPSALLLKGGRKFDIVRDSATGELRQITDEMIDRFGPLPAEVENLLALQQARIDLGAVGAEQVQFRGGKLTLTGIEMDSDAVKQVRAELPDAIYEWQSRELSVRVDNDPAMRLAKVSELGRLLADMGMLRQS